MSKEHGPDLKRLTTRARCGDIEAQYLLAKKLCEGSSSQFRQGIKWLQRAARSHQVVAQFVLGVYLNEGIYLKKNSRKAQQWLRESRRNDTHGTVRKKMIDPLVFQWYFKAAKIGDVTGCYNVGYGYEHGSGVTKDAKKARFWYKRAARKGDMDACHKVGFLLEKAGSVRQAVGWYRKAAERGNPDSMFNLALCYDYGKGVRADVRSAFTWYHKAALKGDIWAQNNLARAYAEGWGVRQDVAKALFWFRRAASQGDAKAQFNLGQHYEKAKGVRRSLSRALGWYGKAAAQGHAKARRRVKVLKTDHS